MFERLINGCSFPYNLPTRFFFKQTTSFLFNTYNKRIYLIRRHKHTTSDPYPRMFCEIHVVFLILKNFVWEFRKNWHQNMYLVENPIHSRKNVEYAVSV